MMSTRRYLSIVLLAGCLGLVILVLAIAWSLEEEENYSRIEDNLYLGGYVAEPPRGTRAVLNLCLQKDPYRADAHIWEPIRDSAPAPSLDWLCRQVEFLDGRQRARVVTFVHCRNGVRRSGMVVTAYLMYKNGWTRDEALAFVRSKRPIVRPNPAFMDLLAGWERELRKRSSLPPGGG
jgi:hypothetical protein